MKRINVQRDLDSRKKIEERQSLILPVEQHEEVEEPIVKENAESEVIQASEGDQSTNTEKEKKGGRKTKRDIKTI